MVLSNLFRIWATRPDEIKVFNPILWGELVKEIPAAIEKEYPYLKGYRCIECGIEIFRDSELFKYISVPQDELHKVEF